MERTASRQVSRPQIARPAMEVLDGPSVPVPYDLPMPQTAHTVLIVAMTVMVMTFSGSAQSCSLKLLNL